MDGRLLPASEGVTGRMHSVTCLGVVSADLHPAIAATEDWYRTIIPANGEAGP